MGQNTAKPLFVTQWLACKGKIMITLKNKSNGKILIASDFDLMVKDFIINRYNSQLARFKEVAKTVPVSDIGFKSFEKDLGEYQNCVAKQILDLLMWNNVFKAFLEVAPARHLQKAVARAETEEYIIERID